MPLRVTPSSVASSLFAGGGEMGRLMAEFDWSATPLGPVESWPQSLKTVVRILLTSRFAMWMSWGPGLTFLYNDAYRKMTLGKKHPWALGKRSDEVWAEIWPDIGPRIERVLTTGEATWDESLLLFLERSGYPEETYHTFTYSPLANDDGAIAGHLCVVAEVTDRVIAERRISQLSELAKGLSTAPTRSDVVQAAARCIESDPRDLPFSILYLSEDDSSAFRMAAATGLPAGHPACIPLIQSDEESPWPLSEIVAGEPRIVDLPNRFERLPSGPWEQPPARAAIVPIEQQPRGRRAGFLIAGLNPFREINADYTGFLSLVAGQIAASLARAGAYEEEKRRAEKLAELDREKTAFFSNVSHEFRTPLTLILGPVEDALSGRAEGLRGESLEAVHRNGLRLLKLVNTLLDFSRIEAGRVQANYEPVDLSALTAELASVFRSAVERAGMRLLVSCPPLDEPVYVDRDMWEKIVLNLVSNAFKFTPAGEIEVATRQEGARAELVVRDTGIGIDAEQLPHIFERFHRVEGARARTHEGTGIGLALVLELARLHGGDVRVESAPGRGTTFTVSLPLGSAHLPPDRIRAARTLASTALGAMPYVEEAKRWLADADFAIGAGAVLERSGAVAANRPGHVESDNPDGSARARIVLADDNADMREYVQTLLADRYVVESFADGEQALAAIRARPPQLVLSDVMMPRMDGFELLHALRADRETATLPIILLSARAGEEARVEGLHAGADDYLIKPFSARELLARVESHLRLAALRREAEQRVTSILEGLTDGFLAIDSEGRAAYANPALRGMWASLGVDANDLIGRHVLDEVFPEARETQLGQGLARAMSERVVFEMESYYAPFGRWYSVRSFPAADGGTALFIQDITERKQADQQIVERSRENEALNQRLQRAMSETHHRVKNNLQVISAMIDMQSMDGGDSVPLSEMARVGQHIRSLAVLHDLLTQEAKVAGDVESISASATLEKLMPILQGIAGRHRISYRCDDLQIPIRQGTALAIIVNELVSNAVKHGRGDVEVVIGAEDGTGRIEVWDGGPGFPPDFRPDGTNTTGLDLVEHLARWDLQGTARYETRPEGGGRVAIHFPLKHDTSRQRVPAASET